MKPLKAYCALCTYMYASVCRRATLDIFSHVLGMDLNFHLHRKTGELLRVMDRGACRPGFIRRAGEALAWFGMVRLG